MNKFEKLIAKVCPNGVEYKPLGEVSVINRGVRVVRAQLREGGKYPVYQNSITPLGFHTESNCKANTAFVIAAGAAGVVGYSDVPFWAADDCYYISPQEGLDDRFVYYCLMSKQNTLSSKVRKAGVPRLARQFVESLEIPLPPLAVQTEIVRMLDGMAGLISELEQELAARKQQYEWCRDELLKKSNLCPTGVEYKPLGEVCVIKNGKDYKSFGAGPYPVYGSGGVMTYVDRYVYDKPTVLIPRKGSIENLFYVDTPFWNVDTIFYTEINTRIMIPKFFYYFMQTVDVGRLNNAGGVPSLTQTGLYTLPIAIPPLAMQKEIVRKLDGLTGLIGELERERDARKQQYEYYRDKLLTFERAG